MKAKFSPILIGLLLIITSMAGCGTNPGAKTEPIESGSTTPTAPTGLTATAVGSGQIDISWTDSTDDKGVSGYYVYTGNTQIEEVTVTNYNHTGLNPDTEYCYTIKAFDGDGNVSDASNQACAKTWQKVDISALITEAKAALENQDIAAAKARFEEAYAGDSTNKDANFGAAVTKGIMLLEDPDVIDIIEKWNGYAPTVKDVVYGVLDDTLTDNSTDQEALILSRMISGTKDADPVNQFKDLIGKLPKNRVPILKKIRIAVGRTIPSTAPSVSEMQVVIDNKILPVVADMIKKIRTVEGTGYTFTVTPSMTGNAEADNAVLDDGDFYAFDAGLNGLKTLLNIAAAYNLDIDYDIIEADPLSAINGPSGGLTSTLDSSRFFTLKSSGTTKMSSALSSLKDAVACLDKSYDFVMNSDPDPFTDNGINFHEMSGEEQINLENWIKFGTNTLNGPADFPLERGDDGVSFTGDDKYLRMDISKFFFAPLDRTDLPKFGYDLPIDGTLSLQYNSPEHKVVDDEIIDSEIWLTSDFPNMTLNGVFPDGHPDWDANLYLKEAILLPQEAWEGDDWSANIALGGDGNITLRKEAWNYETWDIEVRLFTINPIDGSLINTTSGIMSIYEENSINWINQRVWHGNKMWASGGYTDEDYDDFEGVFTVNQNGLELGSKQIPLFDDEYSVGGIASDGTNLYAGIWKWDDWDDDSDSITAGVVKFQTNDSVIPTASLLVPTGEMPYYLTFGGGYLWVTTGDGVMKVNPDTGKVIKRYDGPGDAPQMYYGGSLWSVQGKKLISLIAP